MPRIKRGELHGYVVVQPENQRMNQIQTIANETVQGQDLIVDEPPVRARPQPQDNTN